MTQVRKFENFTMYPREIITDSQVQLLRRLYLDGPVTDPQVIRVMANLECGLLLNSAGADIMRSTEITEDDKKKLFTMIEELHQVEVRRMRSFLNNKDGRVIVEMNK
jgi:hypothetical protein